MAIVDDVATTGGSIIRSINILKEHFPHIKVAKIIVLVDREEGAKERLEKERGGHWTYSDVIKFLLKESGEYVE